MSVYRKLQIFFKLKVLFLLITLSSLNASANFEYNGKMTGFGSQMPQQKAEDVSSSSAGLLLDIKSSFELSDSWTFHFNPWIKSDALTKSPEEKFLAEPQELSFQWRQSSQSLRIGYVTMIWEGTDFVNPMDILHAKNYRNPLESQARSSAGLFYSQGIKDFSFDLAYIPKQSLSLLPGENSPWWPRQFTLPLQHQDFILTLPSMMTYEVLDHEVLDQALDHNLGLRLQYHGNSWDLSLAGFEGSSGAPLLIPRVTVNVIELYPRQIFEAQSPIQIRPVYYRQRIGAMAITKSWDTWIFRTSFQHAQPLGENSLLPTWSQYGVLALEKTLSISDSYMTILAQYVKSRRPEGQGLSLLSGLLDDSIMAGWRWPVSEKWLWNLAFFQEQKDKSYFWHTDLGWAFKENWKLEFAIDSLAGSPESLLGTFDNNDQYSLRSTYFF